MNPNRGKPTWVVQCEAAAHHMRQHPMMGCFPIIFRGYNISVADEFYGPCEAHNDNSGGDWG